jgi:hypothetical protein
MALKGQYFEKNRIEKLYTGLGRTTYNFNFSTIFKKNFALAYMKNTLNGEIFFKIEHE